MRKKTVRSTKKRADRIFSELVRRSACTDGEYCQCVTCWKVDHWKNMQAGHFQSRRYNSTRYDKRNVKVQCPRCNMWEEGRKYEFGKYLVGIYGKNIIDKLRILTNQTKRFTVGELEEMITEFKKELKDLKQI